MHCVCKHFRDVIQNPNFIQTHLTRINPISDPTQSLILAFGDGENPWGQFDRFLVSFDNSTKDVLSSLPITPPIPVVGTHVPGDEYHFVGSCHGLICVLVGYGDYWTDFIFLLWNPVIKQCRYLPRSQWTRFPEAVEFGYVTEANDYQIVKAGNAYAAGFDVEVYKMSIDSWIVIDCSILVANTCIRVYQEEITVFLYGSFHWSFRQDDNIDILYYNLKDEKLGVMKAVDDSRALTLKEPHHYNLPNYRWKLAVIDESLAFICLNDHLSNKLEVWVMSMYGVEDSWAIRYQIVDDILSSLSPVNYWTNGNLLITNGIGGLDLYDLKTRRRKRIPEMETNGGISAFCSFVETLVPVRSLG